MRWQPLPCCHAGLRVWLRILFSLLFSVFVNFAGIFPTPIAIASSISPQLAPLTFYNVLINKTLNSFEELIPSTGTIAPLTPPDLGTVALHKTTLSNLNLTTATLSKPTLSKATLSTTALSTATLSKATLSTTALSMATVNPSLKPPALTLADLQRLDQISRAATAAGGRGEFYTAEQGWTQIITEMPTNAAAWSNRGNIRIGLNQLEAAIADYTQAISLAPDVPDPYINRGAAYEAQQNWSAALEDYNQALRLNDRDPAAYNNRGNAKAALGDWQAAIADYRTALDLEPKFSLARLNVAIAEYELGRDQAALKDLQNLVRKYPQFADARAALTAVLWGAGEWGKAESNWVAVMGLDRRYEDLDWLATVRRWSPRLLEAMTNFLSLTPSS